MMKVALACVVLVALVALHANAVFLPRPLDVEHRAKDVPSLPLLTQTAARQHMVVGVTASNMRSTPGEMKFVSYEIDENQLSQALFYESIYMLEGTESDGWVMTEAPMQPNLANGEWVPYRSYMNKSHLVPVASFPSYNLVVVNNVAEVYGRECHLTGCLPSDVKLEVVVATFLEGISHSDGWWKIRMPFGTKSFGWIRVRDVHPLSEQPKGKELRHALVERSKQLLGWYYFWGGRSAFVKNLWNDKVILTGVDCSGLVGTIYKSHGILLPRDADPMFRKSQNVTDPTALLPGDLFFFAPTGRPTVHVTHVMMYIGGDKLVESSVPSFENNSTRIVTLRERFGYDLQELKWGLSAKTNGDLIFWGRMLEDKI
jgi:hypothetical protein